MCMCHGDKLWFSGILEMVAPSVASPLLSLSHLLEHRFKLAQYVVTECLRGKKKNSLEPDLEFGSGGLASGCSALDTAVGSLGPQYVCTPKMLSLPS